MKHIKLFEQFVAEEATTSWSKMMKGVRAGDSGPWSLVAIENKKVVAQQNDIKIKDTLPAHFEAMRKEHPKAKIHIEDGGGMVVWNEEVEITEALNPKEFETAVKDLAHSMPNHTSYEDVPSDEQIMKAMQKYQKDLYKHSTSSQKKEAVEMVKQILSESNTNEAYKQVPYNVKIAGVYKVDIDDAECTVRVAGFERQGDDTDALYLMDSDPYKSLLGSLIVKNKDMFSLPKGKTIKAHSTTNNDVTITRLRDL